MRKTEQDDAEPVQWTEKERAWIQGQTAEDSRTALPRRVSPKAWIDQLIGGEFVEMMSYARTLSFARRRIDPDEAAIPPTKGATCLRELLLEL